MRIRLVYVFLIASFVTCSSTSAGAERHVDAHLHVHQSRRLPITVKLPHIDSKNLPSDEAVNILKKADDTAARSFKSVDEVEGEAGAAAKTATTADDAAENAAATLNKIPKEELGTLAKKASLIPPKRRSKLKKVAIATGFIVVIVILLLIPYSGLLFM